MKKPPAGKGFRQAYFFSGFPQNLFLSFFFSGFMI